MADQFGWMPGFLKKFLNLDDDAPTASSGGSYRASSTSSYTPPRVSSSYSPPSLPPLPPASAPEQAPRAAESAAPAPSSTQGGSWRRTDTPTFLKPSDMKKPPSPDSSSGDSAGPDFNGYETIGAGIRGYVRGALPPQGVEQFTKETLHTASGLWGLYSRIVFDQVGSIVDLGKGMLDAVADIAPPAESASTPLRRIKVMGGNGNGDSHK